MYDEIFGNPLDRPAAIADTDENTLASNTPQAASSTVMLPMAIDTFEMRAWLISTAEKIGGSNTVFKLAI